MRAAGLAAVLFVLANTLLYLATGMELTVAFGASIVAAAFCLGVGVVIARLRSDKQRIERLDDPRPPDRTPSTAMHST